jgi:hypothetical protein
MGREKERGSLRGMQIWEERKREGGRYKERGGEG